MAHDRGTSQDTAHANNEGTSRGTFLSFSAALIVLNLPTQVTKLMGYEPLTKFVIFFVVCLQLSVAVYLRHTRLTSPLFLFCAYAIGGTANHNLFLAIHEISHNLAFKGIAPNKLLAIFANIPISIPYSAAFKV
jgi:sphingolipid delta-4 desaturase